MKRKLAFLLALGMLLVMSSPALAVVQPNDDFYYLDTANVLSKEAEGTIFFCNELLYEQCGGQIVVAALDSIGDEDIYDYSYDLFNEWGIGSAEKNNGFLLLMTVEEDNYFALSGGGLDRVFSSSVIQELNDEVLEPYFARKDYEEGALRYFEAVLDRYADYYNLDLDIGDGRKAYEAYAASGNTAGMGGAHSGGAYANDGPTAAWTGNSHHAEYDALDWVFDGVAAVFSTAVGIIILIVAVILFIRFPWLGFMFRTSGHRHYHHHHVHHHHRPAPRPPRSGGFGGGGRSSFGGGRSSGGFGGARGGGGRSFGGGAGRGRR